MSIVVFEHSDSAGVERLGRTLRRYGHRLRTVRLHQGDDLPVDLDDVDGVVTCGGPQSPHDETPWMEPELSYLRAAHEQALPVVGVCLGAQILARALGGEVKPLESGIELGWHEVELTDAGREDPLHAGLPWRSWQPHWHREQVSRPPEGARVLARSARTPVQAWGLGLRTYGFQYHPEITPGALDRWAADHPDDVAAAGTSPEQLREETQARWPAFQRVSDRLFESMALVLAPADRRVRGVARDLHH